MIHDLLYGEWILRFAIGLQMRSILYRIDSLSEQGLSDSLLTAVYKSFDGFKDFLLNKKSTTGDNETHIFFYREINGAIVTPNISIPPNYHTYALRSCDSDLVISSSGDRLFIFIKIGPIAFLTPVSPAKFKGLVNTKIGLKKNFICTNQKIADHELAHFLISGRASALMPSLTDLPSKEVDKIMK